MTASNMTFVRWRMQESRRLRAFPPRSPDHPATNAQCLICNHRIGSDVGMQLLAVGPDPEDAEDVAKALAGRWFTACALIVHEPCLAGLDDTQVETLVGELVPMGGA